MTHKIVTEEAEAILGIKLSFSGQNGKRWSVKCDFRITYKYSKINSDVISVYVEAPHHVAGSSFWAIVFDWNYHF